MSKRQPPADRGSDTSISHGTVYAYDKRGCRCEQCKEVFREHNRRRRANLRKQGESTPDAIPHGTPHGWSSWECRCGACAEAWHRYMAPRHARYNANRRDKVRSTPNGGNLWTGAEMEVAARNDLTLEDIAKMLGRSIAAVATIRHRIEAEPKYRRVMGVQD